MPRPPVMLVILDGFGWRAPGPDNAVTLARKPCFDALWANCPHAFLKTSGLDVGLPAGQMGNSEVGHLNLGAGRVVMQDLPRIETAIADGSLATMPALLGLIAALRRTGGACHLMGLVSPGGVHSHQDHAVALALALTAAGIKVAVHGWTDGRDTPPDSAPACLSDLEDALPKGATIATVSGRYFAMDRDHRWERVQAAWRAMVLGEAVAVPDALAAVEQAHAAGHTDEFVPPAVVGAYAGMQDGDALLCFNYRADRVRQTLAALLDPTFTGFARARSPAMCAAVGMTRYSDALAPLIAEIFPPQRMDGLLGETVAAAGLAQLRIAETEKYPHVTYFLNGGVETPNAHEDRILVPSPKVATYDLQPEMSAPEVGAKACAAIRAGRHQLIVLNFANADMVGHTGDLAAAIRAVEAVDAGLAQIVAAIREVGGALLVTADHGNAEQMRDPITGGPFTAHTTNVVPALLLGGPDGASLADGRLADVAPTLLALLGLAQPVAMTGESLLRPAHVAAR
jgi:2,3-bisphosphoglycerate-independent phosphoglycerate mutase